MVMEKKIVYTPKWRLEMADRKDTQKKRMAVFAMSSPSPVLPSFCVSLPSSTKAFATFPVSRLHLKSIYVLSKSFGGISFATVRSGTITVKASMDIRGTGPDAGESVSESDDEENLLFEKLPLDAKLQQKLEQKFRMKLAKKIRLRRKKLVRKRRMRKKGQWPPSKAKKVKNV
ncbi:50S ribosomal protein 5 alpha, chloroplastic [Hevea brasiliensis]|nr:50S ribosomal protein 5 alpha, chloroplastic [Hevea brasiliensis]XP_058003176.1 50S ribosomal protein 5 alpha, chloroplastic [Hevea brasiliensis]